MEKVILAFDITEMCFEYSSAKNEKSSLEIKASEGDMRAFVYYDCKDKPLDLAARVEKGDRVEIVLLDHRIELYVNGVIMDEDWPYGNRLFNVGDEIDGGVSVKAEEYYEQNKSIPAVISSFENAEGWRPGNGVFVGDCMPYRRGDEYHVLYLKDRRHHRSKWGMGAHQWEHISTKDFKVWNVHPMAVPITEPWEGSICTGSWIQKDGAEYLYYTVRRGGGLPAPICRSISYDGYHFEKDKTFGFEISDRYDGAIARDPKVIKGEDGAYHMFITTTLAKEGNGCLAHYVSEDMERWKECEAPIHVVENSDHPECPDYFKYNGKYYLVFSLRGRARYMISDKPFEGFVMPSDPMIPCGGVPKAAEWNGKMVFAGFDPIDGYAGTMTFTSVTSSDNGELIFEK